MGIRSTMERARNRRFPFLNVRTVAAPVFEAGGITVRPIARSASLNCGSGVLTCSWPSAVLVTREGRTSRHPVVNVTRFIQIGLFACLTLLAWALATQAFERKGRWS